MELLVQGLVLVNNLCFWHVTHHVIDVLIFLGLSVFVVGGAFWVYLEVVVHFFVEVFGKDVTLVVLA